MTKEIVNQETRDQLIKYIEGIENYEAEKQEIVEKLKEKFLKEKKTLLN
jgi:uncharacterized protein (UPF0335 family)